MSVYSKTKGTDFETFAKDSMNGELMGVKVYMAMYTLAKERGLEEAAAIFHEIAVQEAEHAGFYAVTNAEIPEDFWPVAKNIQALEEAADEKLGAMAKQLKDAGLIDVGEHVDFITGQENNHGKILKDLFAKEGK